MHGGKGPGERACAQGDIWQEPAEVSGFQGVVERPWQILSGKVGKRGDNIGVIADVVDKDKEFNGRVEWAGWG